MDLGLCGEAPHSLTWPKHVPSELWASPPPCGRGGQAGVGPEGQRAEFQPLASWPFPRSCCGRVYTTTRRVDCFPQFMASSARTGLVTRTDCAMRLRVCPSPCRGFYLVAWRSAPDLRCSPCRCSGAGIACLHEDGSRGEHELACHGD